MRRPVFTLEQLRSFVAVSEHEHISNAAASLFLTQAAVTQQVHHLERALGLQLLEHYGRRIRLTGAGRELAVACRAVLRAVEVLEDTSESMKNLQAGSLHLGASPTCASYYLPDRLAEFSRLHPGIKLDVSVEPTSEINRHVVAGTIDCGLIEGEPDPELLSCVLAEDELILVARRDHPLSALAAVTPAQLADHRYLRRGPTWSAEHRVREMLGEAYDRAEILNLGHPEYVRAAAIAGLGFAAMPRLAVEGDIASGVLKALPTPSIVRSISAIRRKAKGGPVQEAFWDYMTSRAPGVSNTI
ncbi:MAG TPA: LysR substrate-binding domain-containing protein [Candidatus Dormibacteraeota bacterium]|nr:LysR substrate-binding domain-containing protein [Candidatus Dormibacteraeota bacterium]